MLKSYLEVEKGSLTKFKSTISSFFLFHWKQEITVLTIKLEEDF